MLYLNLYFGANALVAIGMYLYRKFVKDDALEDVLDGIPELDPNTCFRMILGVALVVGAPVLIYTLCEMVFDPKDEDLDEEWKPGKQSIQID